MIETSLISKDQEYIQKISVDSCQKRIVFKFVYARNRLNIPSLKKVSFDMMLLDLSSNFDLNEIELFISQAYKKNALLVFIGQKDECFQMTIKSNGYYYINKNLDKDLVFDQLVSIFKNKMFAKQIEGTKKKVMIEPKTNHQASRFLVKDGKKYIPILLNEIAYFYRSSSVFLMTRLGKSFIVNQSLSQLEDRLATSNYVRVNRQMISSINCIKSIYPDGDNYYIEVDPDFNESIKISFDSYSLLKKILSE